MSNPVFFLSSFSEVVPLGAGLFTPRYLTLEMKVFFAFLLIAQMSDLAMAALATRHINNLWLTHVFVILEYAFFAWLFASWQKSEWFKKILLLSIPGLLLLGIVSAFYLENVSSFNTITRPLASLLIVIISAYTLLTLSRSHIDSLFRETRFWISAAALLYFASSLAVVSLSNIIMGLPAEQSRQLFAVHAILNMIANIGYAGGFLCLIPPKKPGAL